MDKIFVGLPPPSRILQFESLHYLPKSIRRSQNLEIIVFSVKKQLHKALRLVQNLASFTSFYFEILSYLACGEKIIRLASKNSVKLDPKSASDL